MKSDSLTALSEQTSQLYGAVNKSILANVINSIILSTVLWSYIDHTILLVWLVSILLVNSARSFMAFKYKTISPIPEAVHIWSRWF